MWDKETIKNLRVKLLLTQCEFAKRLGCRQQTVSEWEVGMYVPANAYCKLLDFLAQNSLLEVSVIKADKNASSGLTKKVTTFSLPTVEIPQIFLDDERPPFDPAID